jgi:hypothetical protein
MNGISKTRPLVAFVAQLFTVEAAFTETLARALTRRPSQTRRREP